MDSFIGGGSVAEDVNTLAQDLDGVIIKQFDRFIVRHPIYVRELFLKVVPTNLIKECVIALLMSYADYPAPVARNISKVDAYVFKSIINHNFLSEVLRNDETKVLDVYSTFETKFHIDGMYWLQYGLALRGFGHQKQALEIFRTARTAQSSPHIEHAYAQQLLIMAKDTTNWEDAERDFTEAKKIFDGLETSGWQGDTYPLVSLAEGHIKIVERFKGIDDARALATNYANKLLAAKKQNPDRRLEKAATNVSSFATTGVWADENNSDNEKDS